VDFTIKSRSPSQCNERHSGTTFNAVCSLFGTVSLALGLAYFSLYLAFSLSFAVHRTHPAPLPFIHTASPSHIQLAPGSVVDLMTISLSGSVCLSHTTIHTPTPFPRCLTIFIRPFALRFLRSALFCSAPWSAVQQVQIHNHFNNIQMQPNNVMSRRARSCTSTLLLLTPAPTRTQTTAKAFLMISFPARFGSACFYRGLAGAFPLLLKVLDTVV